jgi:hypothetical protein
MNNLLSYYGLIDAKIKASDKDLPVQQFTSVMPFVLPDSLWNINRDNLPWTLKLRYHSYIS